MSRSTADPATYAPAQPRSAWKTALTIGAAYMLIAATLTHLVVTAFVMLAMGVDDWTWSRSEGPHPFSRSLMMWFVGGLVLVGSLMSRAEIPHWRKLLRPMLWAALYAFLAGLIVFLLQLDFVNRRAGGWLDLPATQILWVTRSYGSYPPLGPPQYANPVLLWSAICALLFGAIGYARAAGWPALREVLRSWPRRLVQPFEHADLATAGWFLWGVAIGLLLGRALVPRVALVVGIVLLIYAPSAASRVLAGLMRFIVAIIDAATRRFRGRPFGDVAADAAGFSVALTGAAIVLILDKSLGTDRLAVIAAIALSGAAVLWRRGVHARGQMTTARGATARCEIWRTRAVVLKASTMHATSPRPRLPRRTAAASSVRTKAARMHHPQMQRMTMKSSTSPSKTSTEASASICPKTPGLAQPHRLRARGRM
jgi:hypothetical protein